MLSDRRVMRQFWYSWYCLKWLILKRDYVSYLFSGRGWKKELFDSLEIPDLPYIQRVATLFFSP